LQEPVISIAHHHRASNRSQALDNLARLGAAGRHISQAYDGIDLLFFKRIQDDIQSNRVAMDIRNKGNTHSHFLFSSKISFLCSWADY